MKKISLEDAIKKYGIQQNELQPDAPYNGCMYETFGDELAYICRMSNKHTITLCEHDGVMFLSFGYKTVNRLGFFVTSKPHSKPQDIELLQVHETTN